VRGHDQRRRRLVSNITGRVVEIGAGTGLTFAHYPASVDSAVAVEPDPHRRAIPVRVARGARVPIDVVGARGWRAGDCSIDGRLGAAGDRRIDDHAIVSRLGTGRPFRRCGSPIPVRPPAAVWTQRVTAIVVVGVHDGITYPLLALLSMGQISTLGSLEPHGARNDVARGSGTSSRTGGNEGPALVTQFVPPPAPFALVHRPRLTERLATDSLDPVTLVCGPAGSGKTVLMSVALADEAAWVSLERRDDNSRRLWEAVLTALSRAGAAPVGSALAGLAPPVRDTRRTFMPLLVNALAELTGPIVLVLDDVHVIRSRQCLDDIAFRVLHAPKSVRIVLAARADPALPLHVLRVAGRLTEIRAADLSFTASEAETLLKAHGIDLARDLVATLCGRTEGWAAGLRLAALSLQGCREPERFVAEFAGDDRGR
jgi:hypothetical protein